jgi:hypothetical protein
MIRWSRDIENYGNILPIFPPPFGTCPREYFYWQYFIAPKSGSLNYATGPFGACPRYALNIVRLL